MRDITQATNQEYLRTDQYRDSRNLAARHELHARFSVNPHPWLHWAFEHVDLPEQARVLELGCGRGHLWARNAHRIPAGWEITLSDFSPGMLEDAKQALADVPHPFRYTVVDAQAIPYPDASFDGVIANHMLYHVPEVPQALAEIRRVLRPEGRLFAGTNGRGHLRELWEFLAAYEGRPGSASRTGRGFDLENGGELLAAHFAHVQLARYEDALVVTEAEPLIAYVLSMLDEELVSRIAQDPEHFRTHVTDHLARGPLRIGKEAGLFTAWGGGRP